MKKYIVLVVCALIAGFFYVKHLYSRQNLIPRTVLFGNPSRFSPEMSPDGTKIVYVAPADNVLNIFLADFTPEGLKNDEQLTHDKNRGIRNFFWSPDSNQILYLQDTDGDENWRLYGVDIATKEVKNYTPFKNVKVEVMEVSKHHKEEILLMINKEDPQVHDAYSLNLKTGELTLKEKNPGRVLAYVADKDLNIRAALNDLADGGRELLLKDAKGEWQTALKWGFEDSLATNPLEFTLDNRYLFMKYSLGSNTSKIIKFDTKTKKYDVIVEDPEFDAGALMLDDDTYEPLAATVNKDKKTWIFLDPEFAEVFNAISAIDEGEIAIISSDNSQNRYVISFMKDNGPINYYVYDKETKKATYLFNNRPQLLNYKLASVKPISFMSRDGLKIHGYLTLPVDKESQNLPLVVNVHGGPWLRDSWKYDGEVQWLANRGYAVLQINYRGSTGFGKNFVNAGNKEWGGKMQDDLIDGVNWAVAQGIADKDKVAIYGGSYGGYAALVGATMTPDVFVCSVDIVGISNLLTFLKSIPPYWEVFRKDIYQRVGNLDTEEEFLKSRSPLFHVDNIKIPMLIAQGANDPRVKQEESEQIVAALKSKGIEHEYLLFKDEGHGFAKPQNRLAFYKAAEKFLAKNLGGIYES